MEGKDMNTELDTAQAITAAAGNADLLPAVKPAKPALKARTNELAVAQRHINLDKSYHEMDATSLRREFTRLDSIVKKESKGIKYAIDRAIPHLSAIQMLTSQRGAMRKSVLADAKLPAWSNYLATYAEYYCVSASTVKRRIYAYRGKSGAAPKQKAKEERDVAPKLTEKQTRKAIKAITVAGEAFEAYKANQPIDSFVAEWDRVKFAPEEQTAIIDMLEGKVDPDAELNQKTVAIIKTGESYIRLLEEAVPWHTLTPEQKANFRKRSDPWAKLLRYVKGLEEMEAA
jgi:hypothetical protein